MLINLWLQYKFLYSVRPLSKMCGYNILQMNLFRPRSTITQFIYYRKRSRTTSYTTIYVPYTLRIRSSFVVIHVIVLRSYFTVIVYGNIRQNTEIVYEVYIAYIWSYTAWYMIVYDCIR